MFRATKYEETFEYTLNRWSMAWLKLGMDIAFHFNSEIVHGVFSKKYTERLEYEREQIENSR